MIRHLTMELPRFGLTGIGLGTGVQVDALTSLVARARAGDDEAFRNIFEQHHWLVMRFIYGMVNEHALAEELTQETFIRAYKALDALREENKLPTWLCGIAKNVVRHSFRSKGKEGSRINLDDASVIELRDRESPGPDDYLLDKELRRVIHDALLDLDEDKRMVFILKVLQQRSYEEIAEITGFSIPKLKTDLHRAKAGMRRLVRPYLGGGQ
jgi:RNA polymerase sigma-70 factor (ECF subfamily)